LKPNQRHNLGQSAKVGNMLQARCLLCLRPAQVFLASDLAQLLGEDADAYAVPFPCGECGSHEFVQVKLRTPVDADVDKLIIRRLVRIDKVARWRNEPYEPEARDR
jgi:hypothetical protein